MGVLNKIFAGLSCRSLATDYSVLYADYSVDCGSVEYMTIFTTCLALVVIWPIGVPGTLLYMMWKEKADILSEDEDVLAKFGFALGDYNIRHWYWEVLELGRKLMLSGLIGLFQRGSIAQTVLATLVSFFFFAVTVRAQPFQSRHLNLIKVMSETQLFVILLCCVVLQTNEQGFATEVITEEDYGTIQVVATVMALPISVYMLLQSLCDLVNPADEEEEERPNEGAPRAAPPARVAPRAQTGPFANADTMAEAWAQFQALDSQQKGWVSWEEAIFLVKKITKADYKIGDLQRELDAINYIPNRKGMSFPLFAQWLGKFQNDELGRTAQETKPSKRAGKKKGNSESTEVVNPLAAASAKKSAKKMKKGARQAAKKSAPVTTDNPMYFGDSEDDQTFVPNLPRDADRGKQIGKKSLSKPPIHVQEALEQRKAAALEGRVEM